MTPTPPGFYPEYDYLYLIRSIRDTTDFATAGSPDSSTPQLLQDFRRTQRDGWCRTFFICKSGPSGSSMSFWPHSRSQPESIYEEIKSVRQKSVEGEQEDARVLDVDHISHEFLQILGVALDLDPTLLWQHYNQDLHSDLYSSGMATLRNKYFSLILADKRRRSGTNIDQKPSTDEDRTRHMRYALLWRGNTTYRIRSHISFYYITVNRCEYPLVLRLITTPNYWTVNTNWHDS